DDHLAGHLEADADAVERAVVDVVGGAVEGVHDPGRRRVGAGPGLGPRALLAEEAVAGEALFEVAADGLLRADVGLGDEVEARLLADLKLAAPPLQHRRAPPGRLARRLAVLGQVVGGHVSSWGDGLLAGG